VRQSEQVKRYKRKTAVTSAVGFFCIIFNYALGFWYGARLVAERVYNSASGKTYDVGDVISIFFCVYLANLNFSGIGGHFNNFHNSRVALTRIIAIIDRRPRHSEGTELCLANIEAIEFSNIAFHFSRPLFNGLSLTVRRGVVAIVGGSGNGKSTLLNLLMKFYEPTRGEILLRSGGRSQSVKNVEAKSLRSRIGYVGQ
jgi:ATP-binding cassette subfamily B (MDR/TAP) protein 1